MTRTIEVIPRGCNRLRIPEERLAPRFAYVSGRCRHGFIWQAITPFPDGADEVAVTENTEQPPCDTHSHLRTLAEPFIAP